MTTPPAFDVSIVIPCLNEAETLAAVIRKARAGFVRLGINGEVVVADNGSNDGSQAIATTEGARLVHVPQRGYGAALHGGISAALSEYVVMGDADDSYDLGRIDDFLVQLQAGADLVMGNRFSGRIMPNAMPWLHQYLGNPVLSWLGRALFRSSVGDFHCGLRAFRKSAWQAIQLQTSGIAVAASTPEAEAAAKDWLTKALVGQTDRAAVADLLLQAWWVLTENKSFTDALPPEAERREGWKKAVSGKTVEAGWLCRHSTRSTKFESVGSFSKFDSR